MSDAAIPACREDARRALVLGHPTLNGLDFVEYRFDPLALPGRRHVLEMHFLKPAPVLAPTDLVVEGGARILAIGVVATEPPVGNDLRVFVTEAGDFSIYRLRVRDPAAHGLDGLLAAAPVNFKAGCPSDLDCRIVRDCPPPEGETPPLDHMARDFESFRRMLLDVARMRNPAWRETHPAEPAAALVELLAAEGDRLAWMQDAVGTEATLETARRRISARRHARLVDYRMHEGRNACGFVQLDASGSGTVPAGTRFLTRITAPLRGMQARPGTVIPADPPPDYDNDAALAEATVFEATARTRCDRLLNRLWIHDFGGRACCLPHGATAAFLFATQGPPNSATAVRPPLAAGEWILLFEAKGPDTGLAPDADPARRVAVRIARVADATDPAFGAAMTLVDGEPRLTRLTNVADPALPLLRVEWEAAQAPDFALTITGRDADGAALPWVGQARGNLVPVDHGRTVLRSTVDGTLPAPVTRGRTTTLTLPEAPLTFQPMPEAPRFDAQGRLADARHVLDVPASEALPAAVLIVDAPAEEPRLWQPVPELLASFPFDEHFVAELDEAGRAQLRFGDDAFGRRLPEGSAITARFRIGNGAAGNIGAGALVHVATPAAPDLADPADPAAPPAVFPPIAAIWQPLAAHGGEDAEALDAVRQRAPSAMHAEQFRAVTEADWEAAALKLPGVAAARAAIRWTGSWHTIFVGLHPAEQASLVPRRGGGFDLAPAFARAAVAALNRWRLAGRDLAVRAGAYVPIRLEIGLCLEPGHFRGAVLPVVRAALIGRGGLFDPALARFGDTLWLSRIVAVVAAVPGVSSCIVRGFHRYWDGPAGELDTGRLILGTWEIPRLDADPSRPENGVLVLTIDGEG
ncbi:hypothetical protein GXW74_06730 [Roseomonas eburnea]|uniref:Baseplate assembly protein n=1 Tax=Neoroseomonas eburnea TaxID=1346889 RepID=A0A9X9X8Y9_9PROT|nr:hypothetical protein [Neoroseomonas eburnea]MBR0680175.1 hypothetical protein [Neoroseomonas eburnea]